MILPRRLDGGSLGLNNRSAYSAPNAVVTFDMWQNVRFNGGILGNGEQQISGLVDVRGYNLFYFQGWCSSGTYRISIQQPDFSDIFTPYSAALTNTVGTVAAPITALNAGAGTAVRPTDAYAYIYVQLVGLPTLGAADVFVSMVCTTR